MSVLEAERPAPTGGDLDRALDLVATNPGLTYAAAAGRLGGRRSTALATLRELVALGRAHEATTFVASRAGAPRSARGLFAGAAPAEQSELALTASLRELREGLQVSREDLARRLGVSRRLVASWEDGSQPLPSWVSAQLLDALEDAQARAPRTPRRRDAAALRRLLEQVRHAPGITRAQLTGGRVRDSRLLEQARQAGQVHDATTWTGTGSARQPVTGIFPGPRPRVQGVRVLVEDLRSARVGAGWSHQALARRIGVAGTTVARWERELTEVPGWAAQDAAAALADAWQHQRDADRLRNAVLAAVQASPGLSRKQLAARLGYAKDQTHLAATVDELLAGDRIHQRHAGRHGQQRGVYPGPAPAAVLSPVELEQLRSRAGFTQRNLAEQVGTHVQAIRDWEAGRRQMSIDWQRRLRSHLEQLPEAGADAQLDQAVLTALAEQPRTTHQLHQLALASRGRTDAALDRLLQASAITAVRVGAGVDDGRGRVTRGRAGYALAED